jgi:hypothetical protein
MQPETNIGLLVEFESVKMCSNLVFVPIYKKGQNFPKLQKISKFSKNFKIIKNK